MKKHWKITLTNRHNKTFTYESSIEDRDLAIVAATCRACEYFQEVTFITAISVEKLDENYLYFNFQNFFPFNH